MGVIYRCGNASMFEVDAKWGLTHDEGQSQFARAARRRRSGSRNPQPLHARAQGARFEAEEVGSQVYLQPDGLVQGRSQPLPLPGRVPERREQLRIHIIVGWSILAEDLERVADGLQALAQG